MIIRDEQSKDKQAIWQLNTQAFATDAEARLIDILRDSGCEYLSLVAETDNAIVGHILFTPVELTDTQPSNMQQPLKLMGLAPMCVAPTRQNQGIGTQLVESGLQRCRALGYQGVVVLGHPHYYPRFGFVPASQYAMTSEYDVPDEVFMILELVPGALHNHQGIIKYHPAFKEF